MYFSDPSLTLADSRLPSIRLCLPAGGLSSVRDLAGSAVSASRCTHARNRPALVAIKAVGVRAVSELACLTRGAACIRNCCAVRGDEFPHCAGAAQGARCLADISLEADECSAWELHPTHTCVSYWAGLLGHTGGRRSHGRGCELASRRNADSG